MKWIAFKAFSLVVLMLAPASIVSAQSPVKTVEWEILRPDGEDFSVQMPKGSTAQSGKEPYHKFELNTNTYISEVKNGPIFAVVSLSGIKSNPAMYTEAERLNSYVDAFKNLFPPRLRGKGAVAKLTLVGEKVLQGHPGREYRLTVRNPLPSNTAAVGFSEVSGTVRMVATRKRFYAVVFLDNKKDDEVQEQFFTSFIIPEKTTQTAAAQPPTPQQVEANNETTSAPSADAAAAEAPSAGSGGEANDAPRTKKRGPISGGVLNGKAISLPQPDYPAAAKAAGASGTVVVRIIIDEQGNVISAQAVSGPAPLQQASINAALQAKFAPTLLVGEPVQVTGIITYTFARE
jgi:TonB family protein